MKTSPTVDLTRRQAIDWLVRRRSGEFSATEQAGFDSWLSVPEHKSAYDLVEKAWADLPYPAEEIRNLKRRRRQSPRRKYALATAASLVLAVGLCMHEGWPLDDDSVWRTEKGELKALTLADGTRIELNSSSELAVHYNWARRIVELRRGEALFDVAGSKFRKFEVQAGGAVLRDIGTRFDVALYGNSSRVAVLEGAVEVDIANGGEKRQAEGGQAVVYNYAGILAEPAVLDPDAVTAWQQRKMLFRNTPLAEALKEVERYHGVRFRIADQAVANLKLGGLFDNDDLKHFLSALKLVLPIEIKPLKNGDLIVEGRKTPANS